MVYFKNPFHPPPAPPAFGKDKTCPEEKASILSRITFHWLHSFLDVGFSRPLEKDDFWTLPQSHLARSLANTLELNFFGRCPPETRPRHLRRSYSDSVDPGANADTDSNSNTVHNIASKRSSKTLNREKSTEGEFDHDVEKGTKSEEIEGSVLKEDGKTNNKGKKNQKKKKYDSSLLKALHATFFWRWWIAGFLKLIADTLKTTTPLVSRALLSWLTTAFVFHHSGGTTPPPRGIGYGIGLAFALFVMQEFASLGTNHSMQNVMTVGMMIRTSLISNIFRKSLRLTGRARMNHSVGQITTMISTDSTRLDMACQYMHNLWVAPIQIIICIALLIHNLGYSALVGVGIIIFGLPLQTLLARVMFKARKAGVQITDKRVRLLTEVLQGIRLIKYYAWESFYSHRITSLRAAEIKQIRYTAMARATLICIVTFIPILSSVLSFITYALSGHTLTPAIIFSSLQLFTIIRAPLAFLPLVLSFISDAIVALGRIGKFLQAEELEEPYTVDSDAKLALKVDGDFTWETAAKPLEDKFGHNHGGKGKGPGGKTGQTKKEEKKDKERKKGGKDGKPVLPTSVDAKQAQEGKEEQDEKPFELKNLQMAVPRGAFVAIVGRVGSGKSSILQSIIGEMRRTRGEITFGGTVAYLPQSAWIMNASLRDNILFGEEDDEERFNTIVHACSLEHDIEMLPNGDQTEIGEKGINLSGGQKARVSLARAVYSDSDIVIMDDPLSAVDAHVGKAIVEDCFLSGPLSTKTRILVTHALHVLSRTDYVYVVENGAITEHGTFQELMRDGMAFSQLIAEYGAREKDEGDSDTIEEIIDTSVAKEPESDVKKIGGAKAQVQLMSTEERNVGAVTYDTYARYLRYAGSILWGPFLLMTLTLMQGASVGNNLFLGFWTAGSIQGFLQGDYIAVYSALGFAQAVFAFITSFAFSQLALSASLRLFCAALKSVLRSPVSFFDTTPMGRIMSRLSKDFDTLDTELANILYQFLSTFSNVIGTVALVFYTFPLLGTIFAPLSVLYYVVSKFYRRSSVETKRIDSLMRSVLYGSFTEAFTGLSTIRAYRVQERFVKNAELGNDLENRAYYMTISIQRWLSVRLDFFGNILILGIGLFASGFRNTVNPSKIGVVLSYSLSITQVFSDMVSQFAQNEQNMNAVERVLAYIDLPSEAESTTADDPPMSWPERGEIEFKHVDLAYRKGLPLVLHDVNFSIAEGEKIGIVGRTGAGKSSLLQALFRIIELQGGSIEIDGQNIAKIGLEILRSRVALVPQDSTLFLGTLRENLDPLQHRTDAEILSALRRVSLLPKEDEPSDPSRETKFSLDCAVSDEGGNFSAGEKQLIALARALLKNSRVIVLDEATSSVDAETDAKIQKTIQSEFFSCTMLCVAHRLHTIVYCDRVLVMKEGRVAEIGSPLDLFDEQSSDFRSLCDEAHLSRDDIIQARMQAGKI